MYTEDDKEVKVKNQNSNNDYNDFYTAFNDPDKKETKKNKKENINEQYAEPKEEEDYSDFYDTSEEVEEPKRKDGIKTILKIGIILLLVVVLTVLLLVLFNRNKDNEAKEIELYKSSFTLKAGEKDHISYKIVDSSVNITPTFTSSDPNVVTVDANGEITAIADGEATITVHYTVNGKEKAKKCSVKVGNGQTVAPTTAPTTNPTPAPVNHELTLTLKASTTNWTNKDVTITVNAKSDTEVTSLKYAINCSGNCEYSDVKDNKIVVSKSGTTKVTVVAKDKSNKEITKEVTTKIDKDAPTVTYSGNKDLVSNTPISVCVTCSDSLSGCKQAKVCKNYTSSKSNQVITVYDNAGNSKSSQTFSVTINNAKPVCTLKVSSDGTVSATLNDTATYYGFNKDCTGNNELSKKITINVSKKGEKQAKLVYYYVKNKNGNIGSCYITVIKSCTADNKCTFSAN